VDDLVDFVSDHIAVESSETSAIRRIEFTYKNPALARKMLTEVVTEADAVIRDQVRAGSQQYLEYLNSAMDKTSSPEVRAALAQLIIEQQRRIMMISGTGPYAADIIDGPYVWSTPTSPKPALAIALCLLLSVLINFMIILFRAVRRRRLSQQHLLEAD
jgi:capsular polysaccharide biosynthesis protein